MHTFFDRSTPKLYVTKLGPDHYNVAMLIVPFLRQYVYKQILLSADLKSKCFVVLAQLSNEWDMHSQEILPLLQPNLTTKSKANRALCGLGISLPICLVSNEWNVILQDSIFPVRWGRHGFANMLYILYLYYFK